jgi:hypothetical protein
MPKYSLMLDELVREERAIWGPQLTPPSLVPEILGRVHGEICLLTRTRREQGDMWTDEQRADYGRELGNLMATAARFIDDAGLDPGECLDAALQGQRNYKPARI